MIQRRNVGTGVVVEPLYAGESFESMMKRFRRKLKESQIFYDLRQREFYIKPSEKKRRARWLAKMRMKRAMQVIEKEIEGDINENYYTPTETDYR